jgi:hypothetical protein
MKAEQKLKLEHSRLLSTLAFDTPKHDIDDSGNSRHSCSQRLINGWIIAHVLSFDTCFDGLSTVAGVVSTLASQQRQMLFQCGKQAEPANPEQ